MMNINIVHFEDKYIKEIDDLENSYWGIWGNDSIKDEINKYDLFLIALADNKYAGHIYGIYIGDLFYFDVIIVKEQFRNNGIATKLLEKVIEILENKNFKTIVTTAENLEDNNILLSYLLKKFGFEEITNIKGYWGTIYPNVLCNKCKRQPCECVATVFIKKI